MRGRTLGQGCLAGAVLRGARRRGGVPAGEEGQGLLRRRAGLRGEGDERLARVGGERQSLVGQAEVTNDPVVEALGSGGVPADVVRCPQGAELLAEGGQLADELVEEPAVGAAADL